jgi:hypothetical protein
MTLPQSEIDEIKAAVLHEEKQIEDIAIKICDMLRPLTDVSQKQALCLANAIWISAMDEEHAFALSDHMRGETDGYMMRLFGLKKPN